MVDCRAAGELNLRSALFARPRIDGALHTGTITHNFLPQTVLLSDGYRSEWDGVFSEFLRFLLSCCGHAERFFRRACAGIRQHWGSAGVPVWLLRLCIPMTVHPMATMGRIEFVGVCCYRGRPMVSRSARVLLAMSDNRYDPRHGYRGPFPAHGEQAFQPHFHANEAQDGRGHSRHPGS